MSDQFLPDPPPLPAASPPTTPSGGDARRAALPRRAALRPPRVEIGRRFWAWAVGGALLTVVVGLAYAHYLKLSSGWQHGLGWEVALLRDTHVALPTLLDRLILVIPWFGTNLTILPGVAIASYLLLRRRRPDLVAVLVVAAAGNYLIAFSVKYALNRPRPTLFTARGEYTGPAYPSGHAMLATSVLFIVAYLLRRERGWTWPYVVVVAFSLITIYSRLYLGVHWPTDVLAGMLMGFVWLSAMLRALDARRDELVRFGRRTQLGEVP